MEAKSPKTLTVSELAEFVAPGVSTKDAATVLRQLRHWTTTGVLPTAEDDAHRGSGRHRTYTFEDACFAAVALELGKYKIPIGPLKWILETLRADVEGPRRTPQSVELWQQAMDGSTSVYLAVQAIGSIEQMQFGISLQADGSRLHRLMRPTEMFDSVGGLLLIDLTGVLRRLRA